MQRLQQDGRKALEGVSDLLGPPIFELCGLRHEES